MARFFRKYGMIVIGAAAVLVIAAIGLVCLKAVKDAQKFVTERDRQIESLENTLYEIGELQTGYVTTSAVRAGDVITEEVVKEVSVPTKLGLNLAKTEDEIIGKYFRIGLEDGTVITSEDVLDKKTEASWRYVDVIIDEIPVGLDVGDNIDIRIAFPLGEDFVAISNKRIEEVNSGILKMILDEGDIYTYNSMLFDKVMYPGTKIYAVKYVDAGAQVGAEVFYPLNSNIIEISAMDPNLINAVKQEMILRRAAVEATMGGGLDTYDQEKYELLIEQIDRARTVFAGKFETGHKELAKRIEAEKKAADTAAAKAAKEAEKAAKEEAKGGN